MEGTTMLDNMGFESGPESGEYGDITVRRIVNVTGEIWAAEAAGPGRRGYGETPREAAVDVLRQLEKDRALADGLARCDAVAGAMQDTVDFEPVDDDAVQAAWARTDLPQDFWDAVQGGYRITAIAKFRHATGLSLRSAKDVVDYIVPARKAYPALFSAASAAEGTVIRIRGSVRATGYMGYVFEKEARDKWTTTGSAENYSGALVQREAGAFGFDVLYVPGRHA